MNIDIYKLLSSSFPEGKGNAVEMASIRLQSVLIILENIKHGDFKKFVDVVGILQNITQHILLDAEVRTEILLKFKGHGYTPEMYDCLFDEKDPITFSQHIIGTALRDLKRGEELRPEIGDMVEMWNDRHKNLY